MSEAPFRISESPRVAIPQALVAALVTLVDELPSLPDPKRAVLKTMVFQLCSLYRMKNPYGRANEVELAQELAEQDGIPLEDAP